MGGVRRLLCEEVSKASPKIKCKKAPRLIRRRVWLEGSTWGVAADPVMWGDAAGT